MVRSGDDRHALSYAEQAENDNKSKGQAGWLARRKVAQAKAHERARFCQGLKTCVSSFNDALTALSQYLEIVQVMKGSAWTLHHRVGKSPRPLPRPSAQ